MTNKNDKHKDAGYEKPKLTVLGVFTWPFRTAFRLFVEGVEFFGSKPSDMEPHNNERYRNYMRDRENK